MFRYKRKRHTNHILKRLWLLAKDSQAHGPWMRLSSTDTMVIVLRVLQCRSAQSNIIWFFTHFPVMVTAWEVMKVGNTPHMVLAWHREQARRGSNVAACQSVTEQTDFVLYSTLRPRVLIPPYPSCCVCCKAIKLISQEKPKTKKTQQLPIVH